MPGSPGRERFRDTQPHFDFEIHRYGSPGSFLPQGRLVLPAGDAAHVL